MDDLKPQHQKQFIDLNKQYSEQVQRFKAYAEKRKQKRVLQQTDTPAVIDNIINYIQDRKGNNKPLTFSGLQLAIKPPMGICQESMRRYKDGDFDYLLTEYIEENNLTEADITLLDGIPYFMNEDGTPAAAYLTYSDILKWATLLIQEEIEDRMYSSKGGNRVTDIFALKAKFGWIEEEKQVATYNDNRKIVIASPEEAQRALKLLDGTQHTDE